MSYMVIWLLSSQQPRANGTGWREGLAKSSMSFSQSKLTTV
jgi:hypothetical protein